MNALWLMLVDIGPRLSNSEQLTWINEQYKPLLTKAFAFRKGEIIFLALLRQRNTTPCLSTFYSASLRLCVKQKGEVIL